MLNGKLGAQSTGSLFGEGGKHIGGLGGGSELCRGGKSHGKLGWGVTQEISCDGQKI